jgi:hypothetical protein
MLSQFQWHSMSAGAGSKLWAALHCAGAQLLAVAGFLRHRMVHAAVCLCWCHSRQQQQHDRVPWQLSSDPAAWVSKGESKAQSTAHPLPVCFLLVQSATAACGQPNTVHLVVMLADDHILCCCSIAVLLRLLLLCSLLCSCPCVSALQLLCCARSTSARVWVWASCA